jgi:hypothetical protein
MNRKLQELKYQIRNQYNRCFVCDIILEDPALDRCLRCSFGAPVLTQYSVAWKNPITSFFEGVG